MKSIQFKKAGLLIALSSLAILNAVPASSQSMQVLSAAIDKNHSDINFDLSTIKTDRDRIASFKEKYKSDCKLNDKSAKISDKEQLLKAQASLHKNESFLSADKSSLMQNHRLAIALAEKAVNEDKMELDHSRNMLSSARYNGYKAAVASYTADVDRRQSDLKYSESILRERKLQRDRDVLAINKNVNKANGEFVGILFVQNSLASTDKWLNK